jgi:hypothetical protein
MEFAREADFGDTSPLGDDDEAVLAGIDERLAALGKIHRFGVRLIRNLLGLAEHELLHETCDSAHRTLHCTVGERDVLLTDRTTVQTAWRWKVVGGTTQPAVMAECTATCTGALVGDTTSRTTTLNRTISVTTDRPIARCWLACPLTQSQWSAARFSQSRRPVQPSTDHTWPSIHSGLSESRNATAAAGSRGSPRRVTRVKL